MADEDFLCTLKDYDKFSPNFAMPFPFPFPVIPGNNNVSFPFPKFKLGIEFSFLFPFPKIGMEFSYLFPFPKVGNELSHSRSQMSKSHSLSPLLEPPLLQRKSLSPLLGSLTAAVR